MHFILNWLSVLNPSKKEKMTQNLPSTKMSVGWRPDPSKRNEAEWAGWWIESAQSNKTKTFEIPFRLFCLGWMNGSANPSQ
jgi:hypothetical protein